MILNKAIDLNNSDFKLYWQKGNVLNRLERYSEAIDAYSKALNFNNHLLIYLNRGVTYA